MNTDTEEKGNGKATLRQSAMPDGANPAYNWMSEKDFFAQRSFIGG